MSHVDGEKDDAKPAIDDPETQTVMNLLKHYTNNPSKFNQKTKDPNNLNSSKENKYERFWKEFMLNEPLFTAALKAKEPDQSPGTDTQPHENRGSLCIDILETIAKRCDIPVGFDIALGERNMMVLEERTDHIELYISPMGKRDYIPEMKALFNHKPKNLPSYWTVVKYGAFHPNNEKPEAYTLTEDGSQNTETDRQTEHQIEITFPVDAITYTPSKCFDQKQGKMMLNLTIFIEDKYIDKLCKLTDVSFSPTEEKDTSIDTNGLLPPAESSVIIEDPKITESRKAQGKIKSSRKVYVPKNSLLYCIILREIGEINFIHYIANIDICPTSNKKLYDRFHLSALYSDIMLITKQSPLKKCQRCSHNDYQVNLFKCTGECNSDKISVYYCDTICQKADYPYHKIICRKQKNQNK